LLWSHQEMMEMKCKREWWHCWPCTTSRVVSHRREFAHVNHEPLGRHKREKLSKMIVDKKHWYESA
jgi:hypothetical protein